MPLKQNNKRINQIRRSELGFFVNRIPIVPVALNGENTAMELTLYGSVPRD
jgi:hypothetical protein